MNKLMLIACLSLLMFIFYELMERNENTVMLEAECAKTEMMFKSYRDEWMHVYDCSGKDV